MLAFERQSSRPRWHAAATQSRPSAQRVIETILNGDVHGLAWLLDGTVNRSLGAKYAHMTPLHVAAAAGCSAVVCYLALSKPRSIDQRDDGGNTALHYAVIASQPDAVATLLEVGANPDAENIVGTTPVHDLAKFGDAFVQTQMLTAFGAHANWTQRNGFGNTPLHRAAMWGSEAVARACTSFYEDINVANHRGFTPLDLAVGTRHDRVAQFLRERGGTHSHLFVASQEHLAPHDYTETCEWLEIEAKLTAAGSRTREWQEIEAKLTAAGSRTLIAGSAKSRALLQHPLA